MWRLPGLDALSLEEKNRAYRDVGGHPRTLEYLDALLRGGQARFDDVAERMEDRLRDRGITDPAAWLARPGRDLDASLAEAVTLSVDDVVLVRPAGPAGGHPAGHRAGDRGGGLPGPGRRHRPGLPGRPARRAAARPRPPGPHPPRPAGHQRSASNAPEDGQISLEDAGLTAEEYARYQADLAEELRPPVEAPDGLAAAVAAARAAGLLVPVPRGDQAAFHFVHRWTAGAIAALHPDAAREAHRRAAAFWHWRVDTIPQSREDDIDQLLEARYHHHAAGQADQAVAATEEAVNQLQTWGQYGRAAELCRETLTWLTPDSLEAAQFQGTLGTLAQLRGDYDTAERSYRQALEIFSGSATRRAWPPATTSSASWPRTGGTTTPPSPSTAGPWKSSSGIGDQAGMATSYHQLGMLAQNRGDYDTAEPLYRRALEINERIGDQAGMAAQLPPARHAGPGPGGLRHRRAPLPPLPGNQRAHRRPGRAWPPATTSSACWPRSGGTTTPPSPSTAAPWKSTSASATRRPWPAATTSSAAWPRTGGTTTPPSPCTAGPWTSPSASATRRAWPAATTSSACWPRTGGTTTPPSPSTAAPWTSAERIGDQASMAARYHQLGMLAQNRGDYDTAEPLYRRSLEISERIGDQAGHRHQLRRPGRLERGAGEP